MAGLKIAQHSTTATRQEGITPAVLGIITNKPKFPDYSDKEKRFQSFMKGNRWPTDTPVTITALVEAGLVYTSVGDSVRCYFCGGGLRNWEEGDDPMKEHARWYPHCAYLKLVKGQKFIESVQDGGEAETTTNSVLNRVPGVQVRECAIEPPKPEPDSFQSTPAFQAVLEYGYPESEVKKAVILYKHRNGNKPFNAAELLEVLFDLEDNPGLWNRYQNDSGDSSQLETDSASADLSSVSNDIIKMEEENRRILEERTCVHCNQNLSDIIYLPCGHLVSCGACSADKVGYPCIRCSKTVNGLVKAMFADCSSIARDTS